MVVDNKRILIIDDDPSILELLSRYFTAKGYIVNKAESGKAGLAIATNIKTLPDLIVLDYAMDGISGIETLEKIKSHENSMCIPVIILTGCDDTSIMHEAMQNYATCFLNKPIGLPHLESRVVAALEGADKPVDVCALA